MPITRSNRPLHRKPARSRLVTAVLALSLPVLVVALAAAPTASAAKGGGGKPSSGDSSGSSSVTVRPVDAADPVINYGDMVTFDVSTTATDSAGRPARLLPGRHARLDVLRRLLP